MGIAIPDALGAIRHAIRALQHESVGDSRPAVTAIRMHTLPVAPRRLITLIESGRVTSVADSVWHAASVMAQISVVYAVVWGVSHMPAPRATPLSGLPSFLAPLKQERPRPAQEHVSYAELGGVGTAAEAERPAGAAASSTVAIVDRLKAPERENVVDAATASVAHVADSALPVFSEIEVDSAAARDPESEGPKYPPVLMARGIEGSVLATFIVDIHGRPDLGSYIALEATNNLFAVAVQEALPRMKFRPAKRNNEPVRQQVELRFTFKVVKPPK